VVSGAAAQVAYANSLHLSVLPMHKLYCRDRPTYLGSGQSY